MYQMTGLYSEANSGDDSSVDLAEDNTGGHKHTNTVGSTATTTTTVAAAAITAAANNVRNLHAKTSSCSDTVIKCHSRQSSAVVGGVSQQNYNNLHGAHNATSNNATCGLNDDDDDDLRSQDCGILACRPGSVQKFARIKIFVLLLSMLVMLQQALSSGYINSVITTIEKRFEIPSSYSGLIASSYEIGNVITVIFVSYLGSRRHIPVWIGIGELNLSEVLCTTTYFLNCFVF